MKDNSNLDIRQKIQNLIKANFIGHRKTNIRLFNLVISIMKNHNDRVNKAQFNKLQAQYERQQ